MNTTRIMRTGLLAALLATSLTASADDIDIYDNLNTASKTPNVLLVLDNGANFSASAGVNCTYMDDNTAPSLNGTTGGIEQCAIYNTIYSLDVKADGSAKVNLGLMVFNHGRFTSYGCDASGNAGCLLKPLTAMTAANKTAMLAWIRTWKTSGNNADNVKASGDATASTVQEAWAYYAGRVGLSGRDYASIKPANTGCQENYVIYIGNAWNNSGTPGESGNISPSTALRNAPGVTAAQKVAITIPSGRYGTTANPNLCGTYTMGNHTDGSGLYADEWARYMEQTDVSTDGSGQNITTYAIGLLGSACKPDYPALLNSMATFGGGKYFATTNYTEMAAALTKIINEVQTVNSVFSSSSLPVSVNTQGTYLNQIYMGMFRPARHGYPRWLGNLKQYKFKMDSATGALRLADSAGEPAISAGETGFISPDAISFWTTKNTAVIPDSDGGFWKNEPSGTGLGYDSPDGEVVEKGGAAQRLRMANLTNSYAANSTSNTRRLYTYCPSGSSCTAQLSATANAFTDANTTITQAMLGAASATERTNLINWVRGEDNNGDEHGPGGTVTVRPSIHGDVLHSRPVVVSYGGTTESTVVFYGTNDGVFHAVNGNQSAAIGGVAAGNELWGLVLPEFYGKLKRQRDNSPVLKLPTTDADLNPLPKDYAVDGPTGLYQRLNTNGTTSKAYIYLTMRRGGRFIYAINVTDPNNPSVVWKKSYADTGMGELGQTWSRPRLAVIKGHTNPVLVFGAGYSTTQDSEPPIADTMGRGVFILDAENGNLVWSAGPTSSASSQVADMQYSIPGDIALLDRDNDGYVERLYAADLGGNVWRIDLEPTAGTAPTNWQAIKLAALGCSSGACASGVPRKFFFQPNVVPIGVAGATDSYDAVMVGSGDREHPLYSTSTNSAYAVTNRLYMLKDLETDKDGSGQTTITEATLFNATSTIYDNTVRGYYITLGTGEKAVNAPLTVAGITNFGTNQPIPPDSTSCASTLGTARIYSINLFTGAKTSTTLDGGGLPPSPVSGVITVDGKRVGFCIGCVSTNNDGPDMPCNSALENCYKDADVNKKSTRTYWYKK